MFEIKYSPAAEKFIKKTKDKQLLRKIKNAIDLISENYHVGEAKKEDLSGIYCYDIFYNKTNYEIAYTIEEVDDKIVFVIMIGTRENFYDELKKYLKKRKG